MTGNYRISGIHGWSSVGSGGYFSVTAVEDDTTVNVKVGAKGKVIGGTGIAATAAGGVLTLTLSQGDVVQLVGGPTDTDDNSGSLVQASKPVQVITGHPCMQMPL